MTRYLRPLTVMLTAVVLTAGCARAFAQTATVTANPTHAEFNAPSNYTENIPGVGDVVTSLQLEVYEGTTLARPATSLGKPTPAADGKITVPLVNTGLQQNRVYRFRIVSTGVGGTERSAESNPFAWVGPPAAATEPRAVRLP